MYGNGNNYRPQKRSHSPDADEGGYRGPYRGSPNFQNKRHRTEGYNQPQSIEEKITKLGDTGFSNFQIGATAKDIDLELMNKADIEEKIQSITSTICKCIISFPTRVGTYAALIGLISVKHYNVSCQIINSLHASYPVYLEAQKWKEALTIMHTLSTLVNCKVVCPTALLSQFKILLNVVTDENSPQSRSDYYVYTVLSSLPHVALELSMQEDKTPFESILETIDIYLSKRSKAHLTMTRVTQSDDSTIQMDYLESLWVQIKNFRANGWNETFMHRPYNDKEYKDLMVSSLIPQASPPIQIPEHSPDHVYPTPRIVFRIFEDDVTEGPRQIPGTDKIERFCIENQIRNTIDEIPKDRRDCARHLGQMYRTGNLSMKHLLIETILGEMFTLPKARHPQLVYHSLLCELGRIFHPSRNPDEVKYNYSTIMHDAVQVLYDNLETMNISCFQRFIEFYALYLNNTNFIHPWQSWSEAATKEASSMKLIFVKEMLEHCCRLAFHQKMEAMVADTLPHLMPPVPMVKFRAQYYDSHQPRAEEVNLLVRKLITEKADGKIISEALNIVIEGVELPEGFQLKDEDVTEKLLKVDMFTAVILNIAARSLTHMSSAIGKYKNVFKALLAFEGGQGQLLRTMHSCLITKTQLQVILVEKLLKADLIEPKEVCRWVLGEALAEHRFKSYPWDILRNCLERMLLIYKKLLVESKQPILEVKKEDTDGDVDMAKADRGDIDMRVERAKSAYVDLLYQVFDDFTNLLANHIRKCEESNVSYLDGWFRWTTGRMQQIYFEHYEEILPRYDDIKAIVDRTPTIANYILNLNY